MNPFVLAVGILGFVALLLLTTILRGAEEMRRMDEQRDDQADNVIDLEAHR